MNPSEDTDMTLWTGKTRKPYTAGSPSFPKSRRADRKSPGHQETSRDSVFPPPPSLPPLIKTLLGTKPSDVMTFQPRGQHPDPTLQDGLRRLGESRVQMRTVQRNLLIRELCSGPSSDLGQSAPSSPEAPEESVQLMWETGTSHSGMSWRPPRSLQGEAGPGVHQGQVHFIMNRKWERPDSNLTRPTIEVLSGLRAFFIITSHPPWHPLTPKCLSSQVHVLPTAGHTPAPPLWASVSPSFK